MSITTTIEKNDSEIKKVIDDPDVNKQFKDVVDLYYNVSDIAKRAEAIKKNVDGKIMKAVKPYFNDADQTIVKALQVGDLLVKVGKDATRTTTSYDTDVVLKELKKAMPKLESLIDDIYKKHLELSKSPVSPRLYVFKKDEEDKFKDIISGKMNEASDNVLTKVLKNFASNLKKHLMGFLDEKKAIVDDIISSLKPMVESTSSPKSMKNTKEYNMSENEERSPLIDVIKEKKTEVSACLKEGVEHERLHDLLEEYVAASDIAATATELKKEISPSIKEEVINLFDVEDAILHKFVEVGDYVVVVCRDSERVSNKKALEGFISELSEAIPDYVDVIENIMKTNKDVTTVDVKPRTSVKQIDESIVEALSDKFEKVSKYIKGLTRVFSKFLPKLSRHNENLKASLNSLYEEVIVSESISGDHYCIVQPNFAIFGVGKTEDDAWNDAEEWADTTDENWKNSFEVKPCTQNVYDYVNKNGTPDDWEEYKGTIVMPDEITEMKEKIEESKIV